MRHQIAEIFKASAVLAATGALIALAPANDALAGKFKVVHAFCSKNDCQDGNLPLGPLWMDANGNIFGVTKMGGKRTKGALYELARQQDGGLKYQAIFSFPTTLPVGGLVIDTQGSFYGEFSDSTFYKVAYGFGKDHDRWDLASFPVTCQQQPNCGINLVGGLTYQGASTGTPWDGVSPLFGMAANGGLNNGGTVFEITPNGDHFDRTVLYNFCSQGGGECLDGSGPNGITLDASGNMFGTTAVGGGHDDGNLTGGSGVVFELSSSGGTWTETVLHSFCSANACMDGAFPAGQIVMDSVGNLIGATREGGGPCEAGSHGCGAVFKVVPSGMNSQESVLYAFCSKRDCRDGRNPNAGPFVDSSGNIFGTTVLGGDSEFVSSGGGVAYQLSGSSYRVLHAFCSVTGCDDGYEPDTGLVADTVGHLYGSTPSGGKSSDGEVYQITP